jgi:cell division protein ZapA
VEILGEKHVLRSDFAPEYTRAAAAHVEAKVAAFPATLETHRRAILAALAITDELFRAREEIRLLQENRERGITVLAERMERALQEAERDPVS